MRNSAYWKRRFEALEDEQYRNSKKYYQDLQKQFTEASNSLQMDIEKWYLRLSENNDISYAGARKFLKESELKEFKWSLEEYIKRGEENDIDLRWAKELENASAKYHISYLEAMKMQAQQHVELLSTQYENGITEFLEESFSDNFYRSAFEIAKGTGIGHNLTVLDKKEIDAFINYPWAQDGKNFSSRIWANKQKLINNLHTELSQHIIRGSSPRTAIDNLANIMNVSKSQAGTLIMTESAAISSRATKECFKELHVEEYEILATLDSHTSEICQEMDGKVFNMSEYKEGLTAPPFHPRCRTTTVPFFDDEFTDGEERVSRDAETGKRDYVPANMTYAEWQRKFVDKDVKSGIIKSGAISGALNPESEAASDHAKRYYDLVRSMKTDTKRISQNTGISEKKINEIKNFIFNEKHDLGGNEPELFAPDYMMGESWKRLIDGKDIKPHDITLLNHEIMEKDLIKKGVSQEEAHLITSQKYNYGKEANEFYAKVKKYKKNK